MGNLEFFVIHVNTYAVPQAGLVEVVFGIVVEGGSQLLGERDASDAWSFAKSYRVRHPWAQRNVRVGLGPCKGIPN